MKLKKIWEVLNSPIIVTGLIGLFLWLLTPGLEHRYWLKRFELEQNKIKDSKNYELKYECAQNFLIRSMQYILYKYSLETLAPALENDSGLRNEMSHKVLQSGEDYLAALIQAMVAYSDNEEVIKRLKLIDDYTNKNINAILAGEYFKSLTRNELKPLLEIYSYMICELKNKAPNMKQINKAFEIDAKDQIIIEDNVRYTSPGCL